MSTYKEIRGLKVRDYTTNPDNPIEGQLWYNTTDNVARYRIPNKTAAWRTVASVNTARRGSGGAGVYNSALLSAGYVSDYSTLNESWNGTAWTEEGDTNIARSLCDSVGTSSESAILFAGYGPNPVGHRDETESWNGSTWTEVNDLTTAVYSVGRAGTATAALAYGGNLPPNNTTGQTESWNGTSWTEIADTATPRAATKGCAGTSPSGFVAGGYVSGSGFSNATEEFTGATDTETAVTLTTS